jgi:hypothetical protein
MDGLHWERNWTPAPPDEFRERVRLALAAPAWVMDGNYGMVRDIVWGQADAVVWLDYSLPLILRRLIRRTASRVVTGVELWNGNRETLWNQLSRDSILLWALKTYRRRKREISALLANPEYSHLLVLHFQSPRDVDDWLDSVAV